MAQAQCLAGLEGYTIHGTEVHSFTLRCVEVDGIESGEAERVEGFDDEKTSFLTGRAEVWMSFLAGAGRRFGG